MLIKKENCMKKTLLFLLSLCMILTFANLRVNTASALENNIITDMESDVSAETSVIGNYAEIPPTQFGTIENGEIIWKESGSAGEAELMSTTSFICDTYSLLVSETASLLTDTIPSGTTVTWSSQNTDIATVSSSGVVTGVKAGTARINASVNDGTSTVVKQVSVYVIIENGVYYIKNNATSKYLHVNNSSIAENAGLVVSTKLTSHPARLAQLWKINYLGEGCYSIRPMHKLDMCLQRWALDVAIGTQGITENTLDISALAQWRISGVSSGYKLDSRSYTSQYLYVNGTAVSLGGTSNNVWSLEKLSSAPSGVLLYNTQSWIAPESTVQFVAAVYSGSTLNQGVTWTSSNTDVATVNSSGVVTGVAEGTAVLTAKSKYNTSWSKTFTVNIGTVPNGAYYLRNKETNRYLDIEGPSTDSGADIHQWQFYGHNSQKWVIELQQDGYYTIKSIYSSLYLTVENNSSAQNARITQASGGTATGQRWKFTKLGTGGYKIGAKCGESTDKCLAVGDYLFNVDGIEIKHKTYADASNRQDEWEFAFTYVHYYDSSMSSDLIARIPEAHNFASNAFKDSFDIPFALKGEAVLYANAITDDCSHPSFLPCDSTTCGASDECGLKHHKNIIRISNQIYNDFRETNHVYVLWTNRRATYCIQQNGAHTLVSSDAMAVVVNNRPVIHIMYINTTNTDLTKASMGINLVHETAHTFGLSDQYNIPGHDVANGYVCCMEKFEPYYASDFYYKVQKGEVEPFCASCKNQLSSLIYDCWHPEHLNQ